MGLRGRIFSVLLVVLSLSAGAAALGPDGEGDGEEDLRAEGTTAGVLDKRGESPIVVPAPTVVEAEDLEGSSHPPILVIERGIRVLGTPEAPVEFHVPVVARPPPLGEVHVQHALFHAAGGDCALLIEANAASIENSTFAGARDGLCVQPSPGGDRGDRAGSPSLLLPFQGAEYTRDRGRNLPAEPGSIRLERNSYVENDRAGLRVSTGLDQEDIPAPVVITSSGNFSSNGEGLRLEGNRTRLVVENAHVEENRVGLIHRGGEARFDHAFFEDNHLWDVQSSGRPGDLKWSGSSFSYSCVEFDGRRHEGCQRGGVGGSHLTLVFALATSLVFLVSEAGRYLLTRIGFSLRLYSRIPREEILEHETRERLFEEVGMDPGASIATLARAAEIPRSTAVYHLLRLEKADLLRSRREGVHRRFYPVEHEGAREPKSTREHVVAVIEGSPGIHASEVARSLDVSRQVVSYHVGELREVGRLEVQQNEQVNHLYPAADHEP